MALVTLTPAQDAPITAEMAERHLNLDAGVDRPQVELAIAAATAWCETYTQRTLMERTWTLVLDGFPAGEIVLPAPPIVSVVELRYLDPRGEWQTLVPGIGCQAATRGDFGRVRPMPGTWWWPATIAGAYGVVEVDFVAGYGKAPDAVPGPLTAAMLLLIGHLYEHRETVSDFQTYDVPKGCEWLAAPYRVPNI